MNSYIFLYKILLSSSPSEEFGNKEHSELENASRRLNGTDPVLLSPLPMTYTTRP
uniref:Uncharacterized protein n=1 Tax=Heterorhabditis bacteriophora TaxID=37862 RepID=A0A1I7WJJ1_HETBA